MSRHENIEVTANYFLLLFITLLQFISIFAYIYKVKEILRIFKTL